MRILRLCIVATMFAPVSLAAAVDWRVVLGSEHQADAAVAVALEDLRQVAETLGLIVETAGDEEYLPAGNVIILGNAERNRMTKRLQEDGLYAPVPVNHPEGFEIRSLARDGNRVMVIAGDSIAGDAYGLYWLWDRMQVTRTISEINVLRKPAVEIRMGGAWGRNAHGGGDEDQMRRALRYGFNWVAGPAVLDLVPWTTEPEATTNAANRERARALIRYAHALHMKYYAFSNEFTFHPSLLEECGATLNPCDPAFWTAVKEKYRRLFQALPELDGISLCNDDISGFWDRYLPFDVTREAPECDWSYARRFHTFVRNVYEVVAGEFDKTYFHFTWGLREHEVHCQPEVFRAIFNEEIPTKNFYAMPKITRGDRWWFQPYNATFNQTPHQTVVLFETMNYYEGGASHLFPTFSGAYFQRGLQSILAPENSNVHGMAAMAGAAREDWGTTGAHNYVLYRLAWEPGVSMRDVARDFCAIHFGPEAADGLAGIYLRSAAAYKYGLHIEPISYGQFNSFLHMRVNVFPAEGYPAIDNGKGHLAFLRRVYLQCDPWRAETVRSLEQGLDTARGMSDAYAAVKPLVKDADVAADLEDRLHMTCRLIDTNINYVKTMFAYFDYMDTASEEHRDVLAGAVDAFEAARTAFVITPGFGYQLFGVDVLLKNARSALADIDAARQRLESTPDKGELETLIAGQQQRYGEVLASQAGTAVRCAHFEVLVDGQDMLELSGGEYRLVPLRWDPGQVVVGEVTVPLPREAVTVIPKDLDSRPMHPFVLEQPGPENDYTARIYLDDVPGGNGWMKFDLYYLPVSPGEVGLAVPWKAEMP